MFEHFETVIYLCTGKQVVQRCEKPFSLFFFFPYFPDKEMRGKNAFEKEDFQADTHTLHLLATVNDFPVILSSKQFSSRPFQGDW